MTKFLSTTWGSRISAVLYILFFGTVLHLNTPGWNSVVMLLVWSSILLCAGATFISSKELAKQMYEKYGIIEAYFGIDDIERILTYLMLPCILAYNGFFITGLVFVCVKIPFVLASVNSYKEYVKENTNEA